MFILNIINFFKGYVRIKITGKHIERFINLCTKQNIYLWKIKKNGPFTAHSCISLAGFKLISDIAGITDVSYEVVEKKGAPVFIKKLFARSGLIIGFFIAAVLFMWMTSRVWYIEIADGNIPELQLREELKKAGLDIGVEIKQIDSKKIQALMMNINPEIEWIWTEKRGTKIFVDYRKRVKIPERVNINEPCNLVATHSGKVTLAMITEGRAMTTAGAWVSKGQLLAGGILDSKVVGARGVHSSGTVMADVFFSESGDYLLYEEKAVPTGRQKTNYVLCFGKTQFKLPGGTNNFKQFEKQQVLVPLKIGDIYFPVSIIKNICMETITKRLPLERANVISDAEKYLENLLQKEVNGGTIKERYFFHENIEKDVVRVRIEALCNMQIAEKQPIEEETHVRENS